MAEKVDGNHNAIVDKFNTIVDITSSFMKSIFPQTVKFVAGIRKVFPKSDKTKENIKN